MHEEFSWIQLSDLHIFDSTDWNLMLDSYKDLAKIVRAEFLVVTGDYRHKKHNTDYKAALRFLNEITQIFGLNKKDVFLVPGNHDVNDYQHRNEIIAAINEKVGSNPDVYYKYMKGDDDLKNAFFEYSEFVREFYGDEVDDERVRKPCDVICVPWENKANIVILNTSLTCRGEKEKSIVDIRTLSELKVNKDLPTIVLAHHDIDSIIDAHRQRIERILDRINTRVYLCGDAHKINKNAVTKHSVPNTTIPIIVCGKSAIEIGDTFSDLCAVEYKCKADGNAYVQVYRYEESNFVQAFDFYYGINKQFNFPMYDVIIPSSNTKIKERKKGRQRAIQQEKVPISIWLPDAEQAEGTQTRFNSFTRTTAINKFFDKESGYLGVVSVKGIGKTFILQVKRVQSARKYYCLPRCSRPSTKNNWATESVSFDKYAMLKTDNIYGDLVFLWKISIKCYVIKHFIDEEVLEEINKYVKNEKIDQQIAAILRDTDIISLEAIIANILGIKSWNKKVEMSHLAISNICNQILRRRKKTTPQIKDIAIFIDKVDQAIKQINAEPPADCIVCKKSNNYNECMSHRKSPAFCSDNTGCQSKNCCYGCEIFASPKSNEGLRVYENSNAAKLIHVNIWQYLQLALMNAAEQIFNEFNGQIMVFYTIRQEAFNCEASLLGEQNQKIARKIIKLDYSVREQRKIFIDCIKEQDSFYLFDPKFKEKEGMEEYAFVGINSLCHPYCLNADGTHQSESVFESIYRHSFDRTRDIQRFGEELTNRMDDIRECKNELGREELVKEIIEELAAKLAYCDKKSESTVNPSYYTEKMRYLPNYWADNENFENLLSMIDRNLLFEDDIKYICKKINGYTICPNDNCRKSECKRHPFSMLYSMGYLGFIVRNPNNRNDEIQHFLDSSDITYFAETDDLLTANHVAYIIHPALTKAIEKKYNKSFMHFTGFILGKGLHVKPKIIAQMIEDKNKLDNKEFICKYYFKKT